MRILPGRTQHDPVHDQNDSGSLPSLSLNLSKPPLFLSVPLSLAEMSLITSVSASNLLHFRTGSSLFLQPHHLFSKPHLSLSSRPVTASAAPSYPIPPADDPLEDPEDRFQQIHRQGARKLQEEDSKKHQSAFLSAIADLEDAPRDCVNSAQEDFGDDLSGEIDKAIALKTRELVKQGLLKPNSKKEKMLEVEGEINLFHSTGVVESVSLFKLSTECRFFNGLKNWRQKRWSTWRRFKNCMV